MKSRMRASTGEKTFTAKQSMFLGALMFMGGAVIFFSIADADCKKQRARDRELARDPRWKR